MIPSTNHAEERYGIANPPRINESSETIIPIPEVPCVHPLTLVSSIEVDSIGGIPHAEQGNSTALEGGEDETLNALVYVSPILNGVHEVKGIGGIEVVSPCGIEAPVEWHRPVKSGATLNT